MAADVVVSQNDVDDLAKKLDEFGAVLNDREKAVMLGLMTLAQKTVEHHPHPGHSAATPSTDSVTGTLPPLSAGFKSAFEKGVGAKFHIDSPADSEKINVNVKGSIDWSH